MNAQKLIGLILVLAIVAVAFAHGSMSMSEGAQLVMHGWWIIWKLALVLLAGCVLLVRRMRGALGPGASEACRKDQRASRR
jgi:hypothetical protein